MGKYTIRFNVTMPHEIEVEALSPKEARMIARDMSHADIIQDFADSVMDFSGASVDIECIFDEKDYVYDGVGIV